MLLALETMMTCCFFSFSYLSVIAADEKNKTRPSFLRFHRPYRFTWARPPRNSHEILPLIRVAANSVVHRFGFCRKLIKLMAKSIVFTIYSSLLIKNQRDTLIMRRCRGGVKIFDAMVITECLWQAFGICGVARHRTCSGKLGLGRCIFRGPQMWGNGSELSSFVGRFFFSSQRLFTWVGGG